MPGTEPSGHGEAPVSWDRAPIPGHRSGEKVRAKRRWALRSSTSLVLAAIILCVFIVWNRDRNTVKQYLRLMEPVVRDLQRRTDSLGVVPAQIPDPQATGRSTIAFLYKFGPDERYFAINTPEPSIIAYTPVIRLLLGGDGRCAIIHEKGKIRCEWLKENGFVSQWDRQRHRMEEFQAQLRSRPVELP